MEPFPEAVNATMKEAFMHGDIGDKRHYPRARRGVKVLHGDAAGTALLNHVDDISAAGVLCHTVQPVPLMTKIGMALELPKPCGHRIDAEGVVVRCEPDELGDDHFHVAILFTKISPEDAQAIEEFVDNDMTCPETEAEAE